MSAQGAEAVAPAGAGANGNGASAPAPAADPAFGRLLRRLTAPLGFRGLPRLLYASRRLVLGGGPRLFPLSADRLLLDPDDYVECMMFYGRYAVEILDVLRLFVRPGDRVADVGGHIGYFTTHAARLVGEGGRVYTFEPDPRPRECLERSVAANGMHWVRVLPVALSSRSGSLDFYLSPQKGWSTAVGGSHLTGLTRTTVRTETLDALVREGTIEGPLRLMKMDIEGFEPEALAGMRETLAAWRPVLVMEVNPLLLKAQGHSPASLVEQVRGAGYRVFELKSRGHWWWRSAGAAPDPRGLLAPLPPQLGALDGDIVALPEEEADRLLAGSGRA